MSAVERWRMPSGRIGTIPLDQPPSVVESLRETLREGGAVLIEPTFLELVQLRDAAGEAWDAALAADDLDAIDHYAAEVRRLPAAIAERTAPPHEDAPAAGSHQREGEAPNDQQKEQDMPSIAAPSDVAHLAWIFDLRGRCEAIAAAVDAHTLGYENMPDAPTDHVAVIELAQRSGILGPEIDTTLPSPPLQPAWAVETEVSPSLDGQVMVTHRGRVHNDTAWIEQTRMVVAYDVDDESGAPGTITEDTVTVNWPDDLTRGSAWVDPDTARRLAAALAAAVDELDNATRTIRRPVEVDEQLRNLEG